MHVTTANGIAHHWREDGDPGGVPVLFSNSLGTDVRLWDAIIPDLPSGFRFVRYDTRGHGLSAAPTGPYKMDDLADDAAALAAALGLDRPIFVGLSVGGMIGQTLAARDSRALRGLVLSNTAAKIGTAEIWQERIDAIRAGGIDAIADGVLDRWFGPSYRGRPEVAAWRAMLTRTPVEGYLGCAAAIAASDLHDAARTIRCPTLAIAGADDGASPPDLVRATADLIPGARFEVIPKAGHLPPVEAPGAYARVLGAFLKETRDA